MKSKSLLFFYKKLLVLESYLSILIPYLGKAFYQHSFLPCNPPNTIFNFDILLALPINVRILCLNLKPIKVHSILIHLSLYFNLKYICSYLLVNPLKISNWYKKFLLSFSSSNKKSP